MNSDARGPDTLIQAMRSWVSLAPLIHVPLGAEKSVAGAPASAANDMIQPWSPLFLFHKSPWPRPDAKSTGEIVRSRIVNAVDELDESQSTSPLFEVRPWPSANIKRDSQMDGPLRIQPDCHCTGASASTLARPKNAPASRPPNAASAKSRGPSFPSPPKVHS